MQKSLLAVLFIALLSNCTRTTLEPNDPTVASAFAVNVQSARKPYIQTIVILGSSTASGVGASAYKYSWAGLLTNQLVLNHVVNLAKGGYTTYQILPTGSIHAPNRPAVDTLRNLTAALKEKPAILIVSMTTNDVANGYSVSEIIANLILIKNKAKEAGVKRVIITTSHPRKIDTTATEKYMLQRDQVMNTFGTSAVNFFDPVANEDHLFKSELLFKDGIHPNDKGHQVLFEQIRKTLKY
ncbi:SGNH/GDSL hydrolase family protein [Spirosoma radiotolerans]|uniref:SGNH hydrolase-type esterase domain-containing protein n=1 Tax=Spirosoma radiotolerans TaxID=1379870 RepID=A0A0E3V9P3_9BACT|nr:SGNH/GDSL hydrolase family protein [Spirosoma radiotolerans]AKD57837.1 hypothetical protein SD10_25990 [Spirosoma radiotolerans]